MILKNINLDYNFNAFLKADYSVHEGSCIKHQIHELTDIHDSYGGFPETYSYTNTIIRQLWWTAEQVDYQSIGNQLNMEVVTISSILQPPGCVIPLHRDTFFKISQLHPDRTEPKVRANIYLEDWKLGHFIQYNDQVSTHWSQGQGFLWGSEILHLGANAGMENKYTLQVSGFLLNS
jgi:hypothetical protein